MSLLLMVNGVLLSSQILSAQQNELIPKSKKEIEKEKGALQKEKRAITSSNIFSVTKTIFQYKFGRPDKKGVPDLYDKFNRNGDKSEEITYNAIDGSVSVRTTFRYDAKGNVIEEAATKGETTTKISHRYNHRNLVEESIYYTGTGSIEKKIVHIYDDHGLLLEVVGYLSDGRQFMRDSYFYDGNGFLSELKNTLNKLTYSYDSHGNVSVITKSGRYFQVVDSALYVLSDYYTLQHDAQGNLTELAHFKSDSTLRTRFQYTLDAKGNILSEKEFSSDNKLTYQRNLSYDKNGNVTEEAGIDRGRKFRTVHKYDAKNNITESIIFDQINEPSQMIKYSYGRYGAEPREEITVTPQLAQSTNGNNDSDIIFSDDFYQPLGCRIIAPDGVYLGLVSADTVHPESIINAWGQYGFEKSSSSIFNPTIPYGGASGVFSPFNDISPSPPSLFKDGKFVNYLSTNDNYRPRTPPDKLIEFLKKLSRSKK